MYISFPVILVIIVVIGIYYYLNNKSKQHDLETKARHFETKYKKELAINEGYSQSIHKLSELFSDLINLFLVKRLIEEDEERYDRLNDEKNKPAEDSLDIWVETSNNKGVSEIRAIREFHRNVLKKLDEVVNLQQSHLSKYIENYSDSNIKFDLDDVLGAFIYVEAYYQNLSKHKYLTDTNVNVDKIGEESTKLIEKLDEMIISINDRYFSKI